MIDRKVLRRFGVPLLIATFVSILLSLVVLVTINTNLMKMPLLGSSRPPGGSAPREQAAATEPKGDIAAITERNLFRAKLEAEIPKPKTEKELEEEMLTAMVRDMTLKGVWIGEKKSASYAVIDRGGQKGVWSYELGEDLGKGLLLQDVGPNSVKLGKGDFIVTLRLFAKAYERDTSARAKVEPPKGQAPPQKVAPAMKGIDLSAEIKKEGNKVILSKSLAERIRANNSLVMAAVAVKASKDGQGKPNGYQVVSVDRGSLAEKIGIQADDIVQEINGVRIANPDDLNKMANRWKNESKFEVKVLRKGSAETLFYEIR